VTNAKPINIKNDPANVKCEIDSPKNNHENIGTIINVSAKKGYATDKGIDFKTNNQDTEQKPYNAIPKMKLVLSNSPKPITDGGETAFFKAICPYDAANAIVKIRIYLTIWFTFLAYK